MKFRDYTKYEVYEDGRIWSYSHKKWLKPATRKDGYQIVSLSDNEGKQKTYYLHRVVWEAVTGEPIPSNMQINHRNEIKTSNMITNLELVSQNENLNYGTRTQRQAKTRSKRVGAFKDGELVMVFQSTKEAGRQGFYSSMVSACCIGKIKKHRGYEWKYLN
ncbi:MAG: HNH endonuclease signature motif containing protein [Finegoldia magna]|nr:HNH endonuclease signature motif containing protein [Finegoldia magna]